MARKISVGIVPGGLGDLSISSATVSTATSNQDLTLSPNGTGRVLIDKNAQLQAQADLRFADSDSSNWVAFQAPATVAANVTWTLPSADSAVNGYALISDGAGNLSWGVAGATLTDQTASATIHYPVLTTATTGSLATAQVSSTKLSYQPSTGTLFNGLITGGTGASNNLVLRSTSNATKGQVFIDESTAASSVTTGALRVAGGMGVSGTLYTTSLVETSSIAFKENVNPIESALDKILQLTGVTYDRKDGSSTNEAGLIAEEVSKVIPNVVTKDENGNVYGLQYTKLVAYLVEAVKGLHKEITELKNGNIA